MFLVLMNFKMVCCTTHIHECYNILIKIMGNRSSENKIYDFHYKNSVGISGVMVECSLGLGGVMVECSLGLGGVMVEYTWGLSGVMVGFRWASMG